jgi:hypothetical protein
MKRLIALALLASGLAAAQTYTAGANLASGQLWMLNSSGQAIPLTAGGAWTGVAQSSVSANASVTLANSGTQNCLFENATVTGNLVIQGTAVASDCRDSGTTSPASIASGTRIYGKAAATGSAGVASLTLYPPSALVYGTYLVNSGGGNALSAPSQSLLYASKSCAGQANCITVKADGQYRNDASITNNSATVSCSDCKFSSLDVGKVVWVTGSNSSSPLYLAQSTISAVNSPTSITASSNASASASNMWITWGSDDTAAWDLVTSSAASSCSGVQFPAGMSVVSHAEFYSNSGCATTSGAPYRVSSYNGAGITSTIFLLPPNFDFTSCTHGAGGKSCFFGITSSIMQNFGMWGGGYSLSGTTHNNVLLDVGQSSRLIFVNASGFGALSTSLIGIQNNAVTGLLLNGGALQFGYTALDVTAFNSTSMGNAWQGQQSLKVESGGSLNSFGDNIAGGTGVTQTTANVDVEGNLLCWSCWLEGSSGSDSVYIGSAGTLVVHGQSRLNGLSTSTTTIHAVSGGKVYIGDSNIRGTTGTGSLFNMASGSIFYDLGGVSFQNINGNVYDNMSATVWGSASITGTALATGGVALTSGWGSSTVTAAGGGSTKLSFTITLAGSPTTGAIATLTFPTPFLATPICNHSESGTQTLTNVSVGSVSKTGLAVTYTGTLTAANTIVETLSCGN